MLLSLLLAAGLAAGPDIGHIAADGRIVAPEGFRARLPAGYGYAVEAQDGRTYYRAGTAGGALVSVVLGDAGADAQCQENGEVEARPGVWVNVSPMRTQGERTGCVVRGRNEQGALVLAIVTGPERRVVVVAAVAKGADPAERLARKVADTVTFAPAAPVDARLLGCFGREKARGADPVDVVKEVRRCFLPDHRYESNVRVTLYSGSIRKVEDSPSEGRWSLRPGRLRVEADGDSWSAAVRFQDDDLVLDGTLWPRQREPVNEDREEEDEDG